MKKFAAEIKAGDRVVAGASESFREVIRVVQDGNLVELWFMNDNGEEVFVMARLGQEFYAQETYKPRDLVVECTQGLGLFKTGEEYTVNMNRFGEWSATDSSGKVYRVERSMWGRLLYKDEEGNRIIFEPMW